jgi:pyruvate dehydrogenase E1 component alpha subunit
MPATAETNREEMLAYYKHMQVMRKMEIACDNLYKNREIRGFCHLYDGQEAVAMGIEAAVTYDDCMITAYREHCQQYMRGDTPFQIISELMGKRTGSTKGKGGSMHLYRKKNNFYGGHGIVGAQIPMGTGLGFALKYSKKPNCSITMYGDGASNQGQLFEAMNMAQLWSLPVVYVCENNKYGMGTSNKRASMNPDYFARGDQIPGFRVTGHSVLAVREAMKFAKQHAVEKGPIIMEIDTYRYHGHSMSDPGISYRSREEVAARRKEKDPIENSRKIILDNKLASEEELKNIDRETKELIDDAVEKSRQAALPDEKVLTEDIYIEDQPGFIRGIEYSESFFPQGKF